MNETNAKEAIAKSVEAVVKQTVDNPKVEKAAKDIATPALVAVAIANTASAGFSLLNILLYLQYLFTEPLRALFRRKRKAWGVVYNSLSKQPIDLAVVRIYDKETGRLVRTRVTDADGRFFFVAPPGRYYIKVAKQGFNYPSEYLKGKTIDSKYLDLYFGETISVTGEETSIVPNIPLDPVGREPVSDRRVIFRLILRKIQYLISFSGVILAAVIVIIVPTILTIGLLLFHSFIYLIFRRLGRPRKPKGWGIVRDKETKKPLPRTIVRIFDQKYNKLLESQITDTDGHYGFLVGSNVYYLTASKPSYATVKTNPLDLTKLEEGAVISKNIDLPKGGGKISEQAGIEESKRRGVEENLPYFKSQFGGAKKAEAEPEKQEEKIEGKSAELPAEEENKTAEEENKKELADSEEKNIFG